MKLSALHQSYLNRRNNTLRSSPPLDSQSDGSTKSLVSIFWLIFHCFCCLISLLLGFRFSRLVFFFLFSTSTTNLYTTTTPFHQNLPLKPLISNPNLDPLPPPLIRENKSSRVVVGRHGIRIRPWPHPNPVEVMKAHEIISRVQKEQKIIFGAKTSKKIIVITPTYVRTFQALHLTGLMHSLMLIPYNVVWIVVEAGGISNETSSILAKSRINAIHVGFNQKMPNTWEDRSKLEILMRLEGLRVVKEEKIDGIVMFGDDSNMHSMEFFDEIQNVKWFGAVSIGILVNSGNAEEMVMAMKAKSEIEEDGDEKGLLPIQGPACNASDELIGWHVFNTLPYAENSAVYIDDVAAVLPKKMEWSGFVLNSRLVWEESGENKPDWVKDFGELINGNEYVESPLAFLKDPTMVEPLGSCGKQVLLWWIRVEARADSKFPPGWVIDPPLEVTVAAKRTPWPDVPPEPPLKKIDKVRLPQESNNKILQMPKQQQQQQQQQQHLNKNRKSKKKSKRNKHETKQEVVSSSLKHQERNS